jgi:hypothetical protein
MIFQSTPDDQSAISDCAEDSKMLLYPYAVIAFFEQIQ